MKRKRGYPIAAILLLLASASVGLGQDTREEPSLIVSERTKQLLTEAISSKDASLRSRSLEALARIADPSTAAAMHALAQAPEPSIRAEAVAALKAVLPPAEWIKVLRAACADPSDRVAHRAYDALVRAEGAEAFQALIEAGEGLSADRAVWWARAVAQRPEQPPADVLNGLLAGEDPRMHAAGATVLARHPDALPVPRRIELLADRDVQVRSAAAQSLKPVSAQEQPRAALVELLSDASPLVRRAALGALRDAPPDVERVAPLLEDPDSTVRRAAVDVVAATDTEGTVALLIARLSDPEILVAQQAGERLAERGGEAVATELDKRLANANAQVVAEAARALGLMKHVASTQRLIGLAGHGSPLVRAAVYEALGRLGDTAAVPMLVQRGEGETDRPARVALNVALGRLGDRRALEHLFVDIHYPDYPSMGINPGNFMGGNAKYPPPYPTEDTAVAAAAVRALGQIGDPAAVPELRRVSPDVLRNAEFWDNLAWSLGQLGDPNAARALEEYAVVGGLLMGTREVELPDSTRIAALRAIQHLQLRDLVDRILQIDPIRCSLPVREVAAEVLTALTGQKYAARPPARKAALFLMDLDKPEDEARRKLPICFAVQEP